MAQVGHFGNVKFKVSRSKKKVSALSYENMKWDCSVNVAEHKRYGAKPYLEVTTKNCDEIEMDIRIDARLDAKPWTLLSRIRSYCLESKVYPLWLGGRRIGNFKWIITKVSNEVKSVYVNGKFIAVIANVTFKEYPYKKTSKKKKKTVKKGSNKNTRSSKSKSKSTASYIKYKVKKGDTIWKLSKKYYKSGSKYKKIYNANKKKEKGFHVIGKDMKLSAGWIIKIPKK